MPRRTIWAALAVVAVAAALWVYSAQHSPTAQAREAAHRFFVAVVAGDVRAVEAMIAPGADFSARDVIESYRGWSFGGRCGGDVPNGHVIWLKQPSQTGTEVVVNVGICDSQGTPYGRTLALKRVDGRWMVVRQGNALAL